MKSSDPITTFEAIESLLVERNHRGMAEVRKDMAPGYLWRAANLIRECKGRVYILTGFPVGTTFETDGPAGAMALYRLCQRHQSDPVILSDAAVVSALSGDFSCIKTGHGPQEDILEAVATLYQTHPPALVISIERPGAAADGRCYNMAGEDISDRCGLVEPYLTQANCPTIAIGDGGNELGMGNVLESLASLDITPAVSQCEELIVADVSNWAAYALCAVTDWLAGHPHDTSPEIQRDLEYLISKGATDGVTGEATPTEDGFAAVEGQDLVGAVLTLLQAERTP